jgi:hypothetical protein
MGSFDHTDGGIVMGMRIAFVLACLAAAGSAAADPLTPDAARHFIAGKMFAFNCFDGTRGSGLINPDGSVAGSIQIRGAGPTRHIELPAGTLQVKGQSYCASLRGLPIEPCFKVDQTDQKSFRGSISGISFAYCDFTRRNSRPTQVRTTWRAPSKPLSIAAPAVADSGQ